MRNINIALGLLLSTTIITACSGVRTASSPTGPVTPATGSASNIAAGRNTIGTPIRDSVGTERQIAPGVIAGSVDGEETPIPPKDKPDLFIKQMAVRGLADAEFSKQAVQKAQNGYVKALAEVILKDQDDASNALRVLAASKNIKMDTLSLDRQGLDMVKQLSATTGEDFEALYLKILKQDQEQQIRLFEAAASSNDKELKAYANKFVPAYRAHLKSISALSSK